MATESARPLSGGTGAGKWPPSKDTGSYDSIPASLSEDELAELAFMPNSGGIFGKWRGSVLERSGSAPPTMEGSLVALGHLTGQPSGNLGAILPNLGTEANNSESKENIYYDSACVKYYMSKVNLNPRFPPPLVSRNQFGKSEERKPFSLDDSSSRSLLLGHPTLPTHKEEPEDEKSPSLDSSSADDAQCDSAQSTSNLGGHSPNLVDSIKENFHRSNGLYDNSSDLLNANSGDGGSIYSGISSSKNSSLYVVQSSDLNGFPPDVHQRSPRPIRTPVSTKLTSDSLPASSPPTSSCSDYSTITEACQQRNPSMAVKPGEPVGTMLASSDFSLKNLNISPDILSSSYVMQQWQKNAPVWNGLSNVVHGDHVPMIPPGINLPQVPFVDNSGFGHMKFPGDVQLMSQIGMATPFCTPNSFGIPCYPNLQSPSVWVPPFGIGGYGLPGPFVPPVITNFTPQLPGFPSAVNLAAATDLFHPYKMYEHLGVPMPSPVPDQSLTHYFQQPPIHPYGVGNPYDTMVSSNNFVGNPAGVFGSPIIDPSEQKFQIPVTTVAANASTPIKGGKPIGNYETASPYFGVPMPYPAGPTLHGQPASGTSPRDKRNDVKGFQPPRKNMPVSSEIQGQKGREKFDDPKAHFSVEELISSRTHRVELSDIKGQIVKYSSDQNGSRFIQQKLENCTIEEKDLLFAEVLPHALELMTDVFGNYVIQKFFEKGSPQQKREIANKLAGHVFSLSLQMYGCRVIQKALEVIDLEQKIVLVGELDGHVLRCVHDQNGNHVIQKCIECIPLEHIGFLVSSFQFQVAKLSMHTYGCRVIQRILERCSNNSECLCIIDEILQSACILAQDQYGNYVVQHVLEKGNEHERGQIITKLAGQVVPMSQNKFASNVIERCFEHGGSAERELLVKEILKQTEGNNYLLVIMKDQYANYVVQKMLTTCNEQHKEILLSRVKIHLPLLKKYTYAKHIVSLVERLCGDGAVQSESKKTVTKGC
ncbi:pumilio homolog 5-like [Oryza glaberrima]|uniref:PUM-HD domain-containing protein n=1 Tax=Oryza glaberrima TaxID=4538 RepID=I1QQ40_ORYGL|nr:pumilio homolog 5-like [Oryza glaberrima]XP_052167868.1 pumilio homolog 5-like [Oryza glaberrima]